MPDYVPDLPGVTEPSERNMERARPIVSWLRDHDVAWAPETAVRRIATALDEAEQRGAEREREACAMACDEISARLDGVPTHDSGLQASGADECAAAIRARG